MPAKSRRGKVKKRSKKSSRRAVEKSKAPWPQSFRPVQAPHEFLREPGDLPDAYNETRVVLLPVDPYLVHVYWEVAPGELENAKRHLGEDAQQAQAVLRFYDITSIMFDGSKAHSVFDVDIELQARNWYVHLWSPEKSYCVDLGFRTEEGRFIPLARSNVAETPRAWPSEKGEERFMLVIGDYERVEILPLNPPFSPLWERGEGGGISDQGEGRGGGVEERRRGKPLEVGEVEAISDIRSWDPGPESAGSRIEPNLPRPIDSTELLRRKLAEFYRLRRWGKPPLQPKLPPTRGLPAPFEEEPDFDLTEISERKFTTCFSLPPSSPFRGEGMDGG